MQDAVTVSKKSGSRRFGKWVRRRKGILAILALVVVAGSVWAIVHKGSASKSTTTYTTSTAAKGTISVTVSGSGNLEPVSTTDVYPATTGEVASIKVAEGDKVKKGQVLYTLTSDDADTSLAQAYASYVSAKEALLRAEYSVTSAEQNLTTLKKRASSTSKQATTTVTSTDIALAKQNITIAELGVTTARADLKSARLAYEEAKTATDDLTVTAPVAGVVKSLDITVGDTVSTSSSSGSNSSSASSASGSSAGSGSTGVSSGTSSGSGTSSSSSSSSAPLTIASTRYMVSLAVNETDIAKIKLGQKATITLDALSDKEFTGTVTKVGTEGTVSSNVVTYEVDVTFDVGDSGLRTGMTADADVITAVQQDVLLVPNGAVKSATDGTKYVQVLKSGATSPSDVTVTTGLSSSTQTVIKSGISTGAKVVTASSSSTSSSSSTTSSGKSSGSLLGNMSGRSSSSGSSMGGPSGGPGMN